MEALGQCGVVWYGRGGTRSVILGRIWWRGMEEGYGSVIWKRRGAWYGGGYGSVVWEGWRSVIGRVMVV